MGGGLVSAEQRRAVQVVTFGESMILLDAAAAGPPTLASSMHVRFAGAESNFAIGLARLGVATEWISRVGADPFGEIILDTLRREGVDVGRCTVDGERRTGLFVKWRDGSTTHRHYYRDDSAASVLGIDDVRGLGAEWVHLTGITLGLSYSAATAVGFAAREAKQSGATVSFDLNYRAALWPDERAAYRAVQAVLPWTDWVLCSHDEGRALVGPRDGATPASLVARLRADGATGVLVRVGADGAHVTDGPDLLHVPVPQQVESIVDEVGAGDAFAAGFVYGLLERHSSADATVLGHRLAARALSVTGDWENLPTADEIESTMLTISSK